MKRWIIALAIGAPVAGTLPLEAHHSISAVYDSRREVGIEGTVTRFEWVNPHPFVIIAVASLESDAESVEWLLELDNRSELERIGMSEETFAFGDRVLVTGSPHRTLPQSLYVRRLDHPGKDFSYEQVGSQPRIRPGRGQ